jgi:hypothetical protein
VSVADPGAPREVTERGTALRIQQVAQRLCRQIVNVDDRDAATCVGRAVADAQQKLDTVIQARLAEREARAVASKR